MSDKNANAKLEIPAKKNFNTEIAIEAANDLPCNKMELMADTEISGSSLAASSGEMETRSRKFLSAC